MTATLDPAFIHDAGIRVPALPNVEHVLLDAVGRQHVVLRAKQGRLQLTMRGAQSLIAPVALCLSLRSVEDISTSSRRLLTLHNLLSPQRSLYQSGPRWSARTKRLRDALIALDARRAGATLRDIATVIYGRDRVDRDWPGAGLKIRVSRDFQRGLALCNGQYRQLLA